MFQVQGDIATKVADALGVALADSTQRELTAKPTENLAAYDEYLKGEAASQAMSATTPASLRRAIGFYERAVGARFDVRDRLGAALPRPHTSSTGTASPIRRWASRRGSRRSAPAGSSRRTLGLPGLRRLLRERQSDRLDRALAEYEQGVRIAPDNATARARWR